MKKLILIRHGKSAWDFNVSDKDRPLQERGINDAYLVANKLIEKNIVIDAIFSSPANRALHTSMIFLRELNFPFTAFNIANELYDFSGDSVISFVKSLSNNLDTVLIFGHNHAFTYIANAYGSTSFANVPTAGLVELNFNTKDWNSINEGVTIEHIFPKELRK